MNIFPTYEFNGKNYTLPYYLPPGKKGRFEITVEFKKPGTKLTVVSMRNALFMGLKRAELLVETPLGIHHLTEKGRGTWMSSLPQEIEQHQRQLTRFYGRVLIGGLGLGLAPSILQNQDNIKEIIIVEESQKILELISIHLPKIKVKFIRADLYDYLKDAKSQAEKFDFAFYDIWQPTGESVLMQHTIPLRRLSEGIIPQNQIENWNEDEMIGQIRMSCQTCVGFMGIPSPIDLFLECSDEKFNQFKDAHGIIWHFYRWIRKDKPSKNEAAKKIDDFIRALKDPALFAREWI